MDKPKYSHKSYARLLERVNRDIQNLSTVKGGEYAGDDDRLANFRRNAEALGLRMETIWAVYAAKHWDSIMQYVKDLNEGKVRPRAEGLDGRAMDLIVYLILFIAIKEEFDAGDNRESVSAESLADDSVRSKGDAGLLVPRRVPDGSPSAIHPSPRGYGPGAT